MVAAVIFTVSSLAMAFAHNRDFFIASRAMAGVGVGMASVLSPMYISEISPAPFRGRMVAINQLTVVTGILITNLVNYSLRNYGDDGWRWMFGLGAIPFGLGAIPSGLFFLGAMYLPESPRWLIKAGKNDEAKTIMERIGGADYSRQSLLSIQQSLSGTGKKLQNVVSKKYYARITCRYGLSHISTVVRHQCGF